MRKPITVVVCLAAIGFASWMFADEPATKPADEVMCESGLKIIHVASSSGGARKGDQVFVHYAGRLEDGTEFDSSFKRNEPIPLVLGTGSVIKGWEEGLLGMTVGEKRQLIIPFHLAYGEAGRPPKIPPKATLIFDVEMMGIVRR